MLEILVEREILFRPNLVLYVIFFYRKKKRSLLINKRFDCREKLQEERIQQAVEDKKDAEILAKKLKGQSFAMTVKSDSTGHLYGSVTALDIAKMLQSEQDLKIERKNVILLKPIKMVGNYLITLKLSEEVPASFTLQVKGDQVIKEPQTQAEVIDENVDQKEISSSEDALENLSENSPEASVKSTNIQEEVEERTKN